MRAAMPVYVHLVVMAALATVAGAANSESCKLEIEEASCEASGCDWAQACLPSPSPCHETAAMANEAACKSAHSSCHWNTESQDCYLQNHEHPCHAHQSSGPTACNADETNTCEWRSWCYFQQEGNGEDECRPNKDKTSCESNQCDWEEVCVPDPSPCHTNDVINDKTKCLAANTACSWSDQHLTCYLNQYEHECHKQHGQQVDSCNQDSLCRWDTECHGDDNGGDGGDGENCIEGKCSDQLEACRALGACDNGVQCVLNKSEAGDCARDCVLDCATLVDDAHLPTFHQAINCLHRCFGDADCRKLDEEAQCVLDDECAWQPECQARNDPCSDLSEDACPTVHTACRWDERQNQCHLRDEAHECAANTSPTECSASEHDCRWNEECRLDSDYCSDVACHAETVACGTDTACSSAVACVTEYFDTVGYCGADCVAKCDNLAQGEMAAFRNVRKCLFACHDVSAFDCSTSTVPKVVDIAQTCNAVGDVALTVEVNDYDGMAVGNCAWWAKAQDGSYSCTWHGCYGQATVSSPSNVSCQQPDWTALPASAQGHPIFITVRVSHPWGNGQANTCFSHEGQTSGHWASHDHAEYWPRCPTASTTLTTRPTTLPTVPTTNPPGQGCSAATVPRVHGAVTACGTAGTGPITLDVDVDTYGGSAVATCAWWFQTADGSWQCIRDDSSCYQTAAVVDGTTMTCSQPDWDSVSEEKRVGPHRVTVQVHHEASPNQQANTCFSHEGQSSSHWDADDYAELWLQCPCTEDTVPRVYEAAVACGNEGSVELSVDVDTYGGSAVATCAFWALVNGDGDRQCTWHGCYAEALVVDSNTVRCSLPDWSLLPAAAHGHQVLVTVQVYHEDTPSSVASTCFSHEGQSVNQWHDDDYAAIHPVCPCTDATVPRVHRAAVPCGSELATVTLDVDVDTYGGSAAATCAWWVQSTTDGTWSCSWHGCYAAATVVDSSTVRCQAPDWSTVPASARASPARVTVQVHHEKSRDHTATACFSHEGQSPSRWEAGDFAEFWADCDPPADCRRRSTPEQCSSYEGSETKCAWQGACQPKNDPCLRHSNAYACSGPCRWEGDGGQCVSRRSVCYRHQASSSTCAAAVGCKWAKGCHPVQPAEYTSSTDVCVVACYDEAEACYLDAACRPAYQAYTAAATSPESDISAKDAVPPLFVAYRQCYERCQERNYETPYEPVCALPLVVGPCDAAIPRWHYNAETDRCEEFVYGGCGGNENNFATLEACEQRCDTGACCFETAVNTGGDVYGYDRDGFDAYGYDKDGRRADGSLREYVRLGSLLDANATTARGYDQHGFDQRGYDYRGYDRDGYDRAGYDVYGYDRDGRRDEQHDVYSSGGRYDAEGYDRAGLDRDGRDRDGYDYAGFFKATHRSCVVHTRSECQALEVGQASVTVVGFTQGKTCDEVRCGDQAPDARTCLYAGHYWNFGQTFTYGCETCECGTDGKVRCGCTTEPRTRKEVRDLTPDEVSAFTDAVVALHASGAWAQFTNIHLSHVPVAHGNPAFWPWHREYLRQLEQALREVSGRCDLTVPYWDWTIDALSPQTSPVWAAVGGNGVGWSQCVADGPFAGFSPCVRRAWDVSYAVPQFAQVAGVLSGTDYATVVAQIEALHGAVHMFVGGDMTSYGSPWDPLFFMHHAFVDKLWWDWQTEFGNGFAYPAALLHQPLTPFAVSAFDVLDSEGQLCVRYAAPGSAPPCGGEPGFGANGGYYGPVDGSGPGSYAPSDPTSGYDRAGNTPGGGYMGFVRQLQVRVYQAAHAGTLEETYGRAPGCPVPKPLPAWWKTMNWASQRPEYRAAIEAYEAGAAGSETSTTEADAPTYGSTMTRTSDEYCVAGPANDTPASGTEPCDGIDPCAGATCPGHDDGTVVCAADMCKCQAKWVDRDTDAEVTCGVGGGCICPAVWAPVCGADGTTYSSACEADCAGVAVALAGPCGTCACEGEGDAAVCGVDGETYGNACEARCASVAVDHVGQCQSVPGTCRDVNSYRASQAARKALCVGTARCLLETLFDKDTSCEWHEDKEECACPSDPAVCQSSAVLCSECCSRDLEACLSSATVASTDADVCTTRWKRCRKGCSALLDKPKERDGKVDVTARFLFSGVKVGLFDALRFLATLTRTLQVPGLLPEQLRLDAIDFVGGDGNGDDRRFRRAAAPPNETVSMEVTVAVRVDVEQGSQVEHALGTTVEQGDLQEELAEGDAAFEDIGDVTLAASTVVPLNATSPDGDASTGSSGSGVAVGAAAGGVGVLLLIAVAVAMVQRRQRRLQRGGKVQPWVDRGGQDIRTGSTRSRTLSSSSFTREFATDPGGEPMYDNPEPVGSQVAETRVVHPTAAGHDYALATAGEHTYEYAAAPDVAVPLYEPAECSPRRGTETGYLSVTGENE
eukprot:m.241086 g.241086  ORF g.241086 m.241086 type:complete len:2387 (+) comp18994_c0_seq2:73-7233(+)